MACLQNQINFYFSSFLLIKLQSYDQYLFTVTHYNIKNLFIFLTEQNILSVEFWNFLKQFQLVSQTSISSIKIYFYTNLNLSLKYKKKIRWMLLPPN